MSWSRLFFLKNLREQNYGAYHLYFFPDASGKLRVDLARITRGCLLRLNVAPVIGCWFCTYSENFFIGKTTRKQGAWEPLCG